MEQTPEELLSPPKLMCVRLNTEHHPINNMYTRFGPRNPVCSFYGQLQRNIWGPSGVPLRRHLDCIAAGLVSSTLKWTPFHVFFEVLLDLLKGAAKRPNPNLPVETTSDGSRMKAIHLRMTGLPQKAPSLRVLVPSCGVIFV